MVVVSLCLAAAACRYGFDDQARLDGGGDTVAGGDATAPGAPRLALAWQQTCALVGGAVYCTGFNQYGQLGDGTTTDRATMAPVTGLTDAVSLATSSTSHHQCALRATGEIACWGRNSSGELGDGTSTDSSLPVTVAGLADATRLAVGRIHSCAVRATGELVCWGDNANGQLGDGTKTNSGAPVSTGITDAVEVAAGLASTCARRATGEVLCWGANNFGQTGTGLGNQDVLTPTTTGITDAIGIGVGLQYGCAVRTTGAVACWGHNDGWQLGTGSPSSANVAVGVSGIDDADGELTTGGWVACVHRAAGGYQCWGWNSSGQIGNGAASNGSPPTTVTVLTDATQLVQGSEHACALRANGQVMCWGQNYSGELGYNSLAKTTVPQLVQGLP